MNGLRADLQHALLALQAAGEILRRHAAAKVPFELKDGWSPVTGTGMTSVNPARPVAAEVVRRMIGARTLGSPGKRVITPEIPPCAALC